MMTGRDVKVPPSYRPLLRRLQRGQWTRDELEWLLRSDPKLPPILQSEIRQKLAALDVNGVKEG